jgi:hypothetical protein
MSNQGYLIVLKASANIERYESIVLRDGDREAYRQHRDSFAQFDPRSYRGISREPLNGYLLPEEKRPDSAVLNLAARLRLSEIVPETTVDYCDDSFIKNAEDAESIYDMLEDKANWEIIGIRRDTFGNERGVLGFDIGYWGDDHFSLIADTIVTPRWHGPDPEDYAELASRLPGLNKNLLFDWPSHAAEFRTYYKQKPWAETEFEEGEFCIIQVTAISTIRASRHA